MTTISSCVGLILRMRRSEADRQGNIRSTHGGSNESPLRRLIQERVMDRHPQNPQNRGFEGFEGSAGAKKHIYLKKGRKGGGRATWTDQVPGPRRYPSFMPRAMRTQYGLPRTVRRNRLLRVSSRVSLTRRTIRKCPRFCPENVRGGE